MTRPDGAANGEVEPSSHRAIHFEPDRSVETRVYDRTTLCAGVEINGPAIVEQLDATTVVLPGDVLRVDSALNMLIEVGA